MPIKTLSGTIIKSLGNNDIIELYSYETKDFQNRILTNGGNKLSFIELNAVDWRIKALKREGLWSLIITDYVFVGGNGGTGSAASFAINTVSCSYTLLGTGITDAMCTSTGFKGTGSNTYWNTQMNPSTCGMTTSSLSLYTYINVSTGTPTGFVDMGITDSTGNVNRLTVRAEYDGSNLNCEFDGSSTISPVGYITYSPTFNQKGLLMASRTNTTTLTAYINGSSVGTNSQAVSGLEPNPLILNTYSKGGTIQAAFSTRGYGLFGAGLGFTPAQAAKFYTINQTFQRMLNRAV